MKQIVENLALFNNRTFSKVEWQIIFKGCGLPKSSHLWKAFRNNCLFKYKTVYTLQGLNEELFNKVYNEYLEVNRKNCNKSYAKKKAREERNKRATLIRPVNNRHVIINGCVAIFPDEGYDFK